ncbi:hypothetical protein [Streptomyces virginiae]|uniref:hypothetical protein n=1 Tax=Streptomyces virginiae TaxID=1961 RepID=UPI002F9191C2
MTGRSRLAIQPGARSCVWLGTHTSFNGGGPVEATGRRKPHASVRGPTKSSEAEALLRVWGDGGIDPHHAAQRQALEDLAATEMVTHGDILDRLQDNVLHSLRTLSESSPPTDTPHVADH